MVEQWRGAAGKVCTSAMLLVSVRAGVLVHAAFLLLPSLLMQTASLQTNATALQHIVSVWARTHQFLSGSSYGEHPSQPVHCLLKLMPGVA